MTASANQTRYPVLAALWVLGGIGSSSVLASPEAMLLPPEYSTQDRNNIDIASLKASFTVTDVSIGAASRPLASTLRLDNPDKQLKVTFSFAGSVEPASYPYDIWPATLNYYGCAPGGAIVKLGSFSDSFCIANGTYVSVRNPAATLIKNPDNSYLYTAGNGTKYYFQHLLSAGYSYLTSTVEPDGLTTQVYYSGSGIAIQSVVRNDGLQLKMRYAANGTWLGEKALNMAVDYCDPLANSCTETMPWPQSSFAYTYPSSTTDQAVVTDQSGGTMRITLSGQAAPFDIIRYISAYKPPSSATQDTVTYQYCDTPQSGHWLCIANKDGFAWEYILGTSLIYSGQNNTEWVDGHQIMQTIGPTTNAVFANHIAPEGVIAPLMYSVAADGVRRTYDESSPPNRLKTISYNGGQIDSYFYDSRGNVTWVTHAPQPSSALATISQSAGYDAVCTVLVKCNKPNWIKDALGNQTDYTYDPVHGGVLTVTQPAVPVRVGGTVTQVRPQTRYGYIQRYAWYKNSSGTVVQGPSQIWLLSTEKFCRTTAVNANGIGCTTPTDEVVTTYDYGPITGVNNLFLRGKAVTADGVTLRTCYAYDWYGNKISETSPNAGLTSCP